MGLGLWLGLGLGLGLGHRLDIGLGLKIWLEVLQRTVLAVARGGAGQAWHVSQRG